MVYRFLAALACGAPDDVTARAFRDAREKEGAAPAREAARTGLTAAYGRWIARTGEAPDAGMRRAVAAGLAVEAQTRASLALLADLARESGAEALAIKGAALILAGLYEGERQVADADLIVRPADLPAWTAAAVKADAVVVPCAQAHELAYVWRGPALVELHGGLPAAVGKDCGAGWDEVRPLASPAAPGWHGVRPVLGRAAREIAVHHFVLHHGGDPAHAFRALQDLARLKDEGPGLDWKAHSPGGALQRLSSIVESVRRGDFSGRVAEFLRRFDAVQALHVSSETGFADVIDRWLALRRGAGEGRLAFVLGRAFPPGLPAAERVKRPFHLAARYLAGAAKRRSASSRELLGWRRFLEGA